MVSRKNIKKHALISVYNKSKLDYLCKNLKKFNYEFISTGSTCKKILSLGHNCKEISEVTKFKEILDGRVKTLNPNVFGSILYKRSDKDHISQFNSLGFPSIDIVIVNFYPFDDFYKYSNEEDIIELIDIGGPSLIRAASKNYKYITALSNIEDYPKLIQNLKKNSGKTDINFRKAMAYKSFDLISKYDNSISNWLKNGKKIQNRVDLRYGENPNQVSHILNNNSLSIHDLQLSGKEISYNNIVDVDNGIKCLNEFIEPTCVIIKHNNPCGVASSTSIETAYKKALESDSKSAFGGILLLNRKINKKIASLISKSFFELILATDFNKDALKILSKKKRLILLKSDKIKIPKREFRSTLFGDLYQSIDTEKINKKFLNLVAYKSASTNSLKDLIFALKVVKHLKSNAIVLSHNLQTVGIGCGQTNRVDSLEIALRRYKNKFKSKNFVCASDGFFPFTDSLKILKKNKCHVVGQPSGSINDNKNINFANKNKMTLYHINNRLFKH